MPQRETNDTNIDHSEVTMKTKALLNKKGPNHFLFFLDFKY